MTKDEGRVESDWHSLGVLRPLISRFELGHSFGCRHSCFVIQLIPLDRPIRVAIRRTNLLYPLRVRVLFVRLRLLRPPAPPLRPATIAKWQHLRAEDRQWSCPRASGNLARKVAVSFRR